ncbi:MAG: diacylglycerol kinase family lipid kinase [Firmicutes bacterium]|nr:diacylglycerol kinase family lipid kinase [Bacillota bacterium]HOB35059.1 diacylglycerol kinase family lipid kinase [Bacillota bacterium]HPZ91460.1 diacylglycerol kinase family lipid kinase [Bacillota bacterium]HQE01277.1 diacylglycerol kinase family lipid kinase [Bacillota bacterium]
MDNVFVLVNPASANGTTERIWPEIAAVMKDRGLDIRYHLTTAVFQAPDVVRNALKEGMTTIIAVGGDGTVNEVVNGFFEGGEPINPQARLGVISRGTGCDLIKTLGIPKDYEGAIDTIARNRERTLDVVEATFTAADGSSRTRYFINIADCGLGATVAARVNDRSKSAGGFLSFLSGTLWSILSYKNVQARVVADGREVHQGAMVLAAVANGRYFGGGMHLAPHADMEDGKMDLIVVRGMNKVSMLANLARIYKGTHLTHPKISAFQARVVEISGEEPLLMEMDGETPGNSPVRFEVVPRAVKVLA